MMHLLTQINFQRKPFQSVPRIFIQALSLSLVFFEFVATPNLVDPIVSLLSVHTSTQALDYSLCCPGDAIKKERGVCDSVIFNEVMTSLHS